MEFNGENYLKNSKEQYKLGKKLLDFVRTLDNSHIIYTLDLGCGTGQITNKVFNILKTSQIDAIDISESQINVAKRINSSKINFFKSGILEYKYNKTYDLIISNACLHWITNQNKLYKKISALLKKDGVAYIHTGGKNSYYEYHQAVRDIIRENNWEEYFRNWKVPLFYPSPEELYAILRDKGFSDILIESKAYKDIKTRNELKAFINASLLPYLSKLPKTYHKKLIKQFKDKAENEEVFIHRLYLYLKK